MIREYGNDDNRLDFEHNEEMNEMIEFREQLGMVINFNFLWPQMFDLCMILIKLKIYFHNILKNKRQRI